MGVSSFRSLALSASLGFAIFDNLKFFSHWVLWASWAVKQIAYRILGSVKIWWTGDTEWNKNAVALCVQGTEERREYDNRDNLEWLSPFNDLEKNAIKLALKIVRSGSRSPVNETCGIWKSWNASLTTSFQSTSLLLIPALVFSPCSRRYLLIAFKFLYPCTCHMHHHANRPCKPLEKWWNQGAFTHDVRDLWEFGQGSVSTLGRKWPVEQQCRLKRTAVWFGLWYQW